MITVPPVKSAQKVPTRPPRSKPESRRFLTVISHVYFPPRTLGRQLRRLLEHQGILAPKVDSRGNRGDHVAVYLDVGKFGGYDEDGALYARSRSAFTLDECLVRAYAL